MPLRLAWRALEYAWLRLFEEISTSVYAALPDGQDARLPLADGLPLCGDFGFADGTLGGGVLVVGVLGVVGAVSSGTVLGGPVGEWSPWGATALATGTLLFAAFFFWLSFVSCAMAKPLPTPIARTAIAPAAVHARAPRERREPSVTS